MKLLDTTVMIDIDRGGSEVLNKARKLDREGTHAISAVTQYEFYWGIFRRYGKGSIKYNEAMAKEEMLFSRFYVLPVTSEIAIKAAEIGTYLISEGKEVICVTEGSNHTTDIKHLQSWNIAESYASRRGVVSPTGSKTAAWYQTETMGTRETQYALPTIVGVSDIKPMNGKILQMAFWESDQFVVLLKQGNSCRGKGLTGARVISGAHLPHSEVENR